MGRRGEQNNQKSIDFFHPANINVEEAEKDAREALQEAKDEARDGDVLAILLQVFQSARSSVLDSEEDPTDYTWTEVLGYCSRLCALCDRNFLSLAGQPGPDDFPLRVVASVYAECGRTLSVAGRPAEARNRLQKALNIFGLISEPTEEEAWLLAGCRASLARALRQLGQLKGAQDEFLQALQLMADLPESYEVAELLSEYCEALGEAPKGDRLVSSALVDLMATMMEEKFGEGSEEHIQALQELSAACVAAEKPALAAPLFVTLSRLLREYYGDEPDTWEMQELQAVEEKAAQCLEGGAAVHMSEGDLEAAVALWSLALRMREGLHAEEEVLTEMRQSLDALKQAAAAAAASEAEGPASTLAPEDAQQTEASDPLETSKEEEEDARPDSWDETDEPSASSSIKEGLARFGASTLLLSTGAFAIQAFIDGWPKYLAARLGAATRSAGSSAESRGCLGLAPTAVDKNEASMQVPGVLASSAGLTACSKMQWWEQALVLFFDMQAASVSPDAVCHSTLVLKRSSTIDKTAAKLPLYQNANMDHIEEPIFVNEPFTVRYPLTRALSLCSAAWPAKRRE
eukprot:s487_g21.t1